jgi:SAM-dependent methyltransferase
MTGVGMGHLSALYADTSDPWGCEHSPYEQAKYRATRGALSRLYYRSVFELGCGNGQLARHLIGACDFYTGMDAVEKPLEAARTAVPEGRFVKGYYPCALPDGDFDLIVLSEILYFLDCDSIRELAGDIAARWPEAEVICVTWRGPSGNPLQGEEALCTFVAALETHAFACITQTLDYRIDRGISQVRP